MNTHQRMSQFVEAFNNMDVDAMAPFLSDRLAFYGPAPQPLSKAQFMGMLRMLLAAFPDIRMNVVLVSVEDVQATITSAMEGTHSGTLDMTAFGGGPIPATHKAFKLPPGTFDYVWADNQIQSIRGRPNPGGGFEGILHQLGLTSA